MTEAEAKEYMENEILCIRKAEVCDRDCGKCELVKETGPLLEAYDMAIKALETNDKITEIVNRQLIAGKNNYKEIYNSFHEIAKVVQDNYRWSEV